MQPHLPILTVFLLRCIGEEVLRTSATRHREPAVANTRIDVGHRQIVELKAAYHKQIHSDGLLEGESFNLH